MGWHLADSAVDHMELQWEPNGIASTSIDYITYSGYENFKTASSRDGVG